MIAHADGIGVWFLQSVPGQYGILFEVGLALCVLGLEVCFESSDLNFGL